MSDPLEELYTNYKSVILNYLYRSTLNQHIAEELTHDTFLKAFKGYHRFKGDSSMKTWLFKIARNTFLNYLDKKGTKLVLQFDPNAFLITDQKDDYKAIVENMLIKKILLKLDEKSRTLIILRDQNGFSYKEIANILNETEGQIKIGLFRARKKFKEYYQQEVKEEL